MQAPLPAWGERLFLSGLYSVCSPSTLRGVCVSSCISAIHWNISANLFNASKFLFLFVGNRTSGIGFWGIFQCRKLVWIFHLLPTCMAHFLMVGKIPLYLSSAPYVCWACISCRLGTPACEGQCTILLFHRVPSSRSFTIFVDTNSPPFGAMGVGF